MEKELLFSSAVGAITFPSLLAASQILVFRPLRISYRAGSITSPLLGLASVTLAGCGATLAALKTVSVVQQRLSSSDVDLSLSRSDVLISTCASVVIFRALGGRFGAVLPSNLIRPGVFAVEWIPALNESQAASAGEREVVKSLGAKHGCHSCGRKRSIDFVSDHQPPSRLLGNHKNGKMRLGEADPFLQRFYPQCVRCSNVQGGLLAANGNKAAASSKAIRTHFTILKPYHLFLPVPFGLAYFKTNFMANYAALANTRVTGRTSGDSELPSSQPVAAADQSNGSAVVEKAGSKTPMGLLAMNSNISDLVTNFPLLIVWQRVVQFLESFQSPTGAFHMTLWAFTIIAALGTM